jgi:hypothetical protein
LCGVEKGGEDMMKKRKKWRKRELRGSYGTGRKEEETLTEKKRQENGIGHICVLFGNEMTSRNLQRAVVVVCNKCEQQSVSFIQ